MIRSDRFFDQVLTNSLALAAGHLRARGLTIRRSHLFYLVGTSQRDRTVVHSKALEHTGVPIFRTRVRIIPHQKPEQHGYRRAGSEVRYAGLTANASLFTTPSRR